MQNIRTVEKNGKKKEKVPQIDLLIQIKISKKDKLKKKENVMDE